MRLNYVPGGSALVGRFKTGAALVDFQSVIWLSGGAGSVTDPANATDLTKAFGVVTKEIATYSTTQGDTEGLAEVVWDPNAVFRGRVVPSATAGTAYADTDGYLLTVDTADSTGVDIADADIGGSDNDLNDGFIFGLSGANKGLSRIITTWNVTGTKATVTVPFPHTIAAGDTFVASPFAPGVVNAQMTSNYVQFNGTIAGATGGEAVIRSVHCNYSENGATAAAPILEIDFVLRDHSLNPMS